MHLVDIVSHAGMGIFAEIAMILFLLAFAVIAIATYRPGNRGAMDAAARLPLEDEPAQREEEIRS